MPVAIKAVAVGVVTTTMSALSLSFDHAVKLTSTALCASPNTVRAAVEEINTTNALVPTRRSRRRVAADDDDHPIDVDIVERGPSLEAETLIHHIVTISFVNTSTSMPPR